MPQSHQNLYRNELLRILPENELAELRSSLHSMTLPLRLPLIFANKRIEYAYFLEQGVASIVNEGAEGKVELGIIGWEGFVGIPLVLGSDRMPFDVFMQIEGHGSRIEASRLVALWRDCRLCERLASLQPCHERTNRTDRVLECEQFPGGTPSALASHVPRPQR